MLQSEETKKLLATISACLLLNDKDVETIKSANNSEIPTKSGVIEAYKLFSYQIPHSFGKSSHRCISTNEIEFVLGEKSYIWKINEVSTLNALVDILYETFYKHIY